ncbi:hypothetical protein GGR52DRAFT_585769, partial [Hypoxylon sp. FL1284]
PYPLYSRASITPYHTIPLRLSPNITSTVTQQPRTPLVPQAEHGQGTPAPPDPSSTDAPAPARRLPRTFRHRRGRAARLHARHVPIPRVDTNTGLQPRRSTPTASHAATCRMRPRPGPSADHRDPAHRAAVAASLRPAPLHRQRRQRRDKTEPQTKNQPPPRVPSSRHPRARGARSRRASTAGRETGAAPGDGGAAADGGPGRVRVRVLPRLVFAGLAWEERRRGYVAAEVRLRAAAAAGGARGGGRVRGCGLGCLG